MRYIWIEIYYLDMLFYHNYILDIFKKTYIYIYIHTYIYIYIYICRNIMNIDWHRYSYCETSVNQQERDSLTREEGEILELEIELYSIDTNCAFHNLLNAEVVLDTLSQHLVLLKEPLSRSVSQLSAELALVIGSNCWKADHPSDIAVKDVVDSAVKTILKIELRGAALKFGSSSYNQGNVM